MIGVPVREDDKRLPSPTEAERVWPRLFIAVRTGAEVKEQKGALIAIEEADRRALADIVGDESINCPTVGDEAVNFRYPLRPAKDPRRIQPRVPHFGARP